MRVVTEKFEVYSFKEASSELKDKIRENFARDSWHFEWSFADRLDTLKKLSEVLCARLDYSISCVVSRGEFIAIEGDLNFDNLKEVLEGNCTLTGMGYDSDILDRLDSNNLNEESLQSVLDDYLERIHNEYQYSLTDEYLSDLCEANEYEFLSTGEMY